MMFKDAREQRGAQAAALASGLKEQLKGIEKQAEQFPERIMQASNAAVIQAYEKKIADPDTEKILLTEKPENQARPKRGFDELFKHLFFPVFSGLSREFLTRITKWRTEWDSNPRDACTPAGFQDRCLQPLGHPSGNGFTIITARTASGKRRYPRDRTRILLRRYSIPPTRT